VGAITAGVTAFYVFRAFFMAFFGRYRGHHHPHESPLVMTGPLMVLAVLSLGGGFLSVPKWLAPTFPLPESENMTPMIISVIFGLCGIALAWLMYVNKPSLAESAKTAAGPLYTLVYNKYYIDEIYSAIIVKPLELFSKYALWKGVDDTVIDKGAVNGLGHLVRGWGNLFRLLQSGSIRNYATWVLAGSLLIIFVLGLVGGAQ
jgi:NADH-quinone oxidoreductase subunit L